VDEVAKDLQFVGTSSIEDCTRFDFAIFVPSQTVDTAQMGAGLQVHGESDEDNLAVARETARKQAMDEAVRTAISQAYLRQNKPLPGSLDGRISWYEISNEGRDPDSGTYTVDMTVWVTLPQQPSPAAQSGGQSDGQSSGESNGQS
jgi:hypothetical protein